MRIEDWNDGALAEIPYFNAGARGRKERAVLRIETARVDHLPEALDALLIASDLQGVALEPAGGPSKAKTSQGGVIRLLGSRLARMLVGLHQDGVAPDPARTGVLLAGDLYSHPTATVRGASGDVRSVWHSFADSFRWVLGVHGNHDDFGGESLFGPVLGSPNAYVLDGDIATRDELQVGGVSFIVGKPTKAGRRAEAEFFQQLERVLGKEPEIVLLHQGPKGGRAQIGDQRISDLLMESKVPLTVFGHQHWSEPLYEPTSGCQFVNVDARAVLLLAPKPAEGPSGP